MTRHLLSLTLLLLSPIILFAQLADYSAAATPATLKEEANAVIREASVTVDIQALDKVITTRRVVVTVLNKKGNEYAHLSEHYNGSFSEITSIHATLYDDKGKEIKKLRKKDVVDYSPFSDGGIEDIHYNILKFAPDTYPYTCEYEVEKVETGTLFLPLWMPHPHHDCAVQSASFEVHYPSGFPLRYRTFNYDKGVTVTQENGKNVLRAAIANVPAKEERDAFSAVDNFYLPAILLASDTFMLADRPGSMATWKDLGRFMYTLNANRDTLPQPTRAIVHQLTDTCKNAQQKIALLYNYLQKNTRYVSIQLGIGGWQTLKADFVATKGYGDCKALSNYMHALLKEAGITSYQALVHGGTDNERKLIENFPSSQFDHAILCVPGNKDTMWLECTSQNLPSTYLSNFTADRKVLLLGPDGGTVVQTPRYTKTDNFLNRKAEVTLNNEGILSGRLTRYMSGSFWNNEADVKDLSKTELEEHFNELFKAGTCVTKHYTISDNKCTGTPTLTEDIDFTGTGVVSVSQQHLFINPHLFATLILQPHSSEKRKTDFRIPFPYQVSDSIIIHLPEGKYVIEEPKQSNIQTAFGGFHYNTSINNNTLMIAVSYDLINGTFPAAQFDEYIKLAKLSKSALAAQIAVKKL